MAWEGSTRRSRLPPDWQIIRRKRLRKDGYMCRWVLPDGSLCLDTATDVDHISPGDDHRQVNLQSLCGMHHSRKSSQEGGQASQAVRSKRSQQFRRTEAHPGLR